MQEIVGASKAELIALAHEGLLVPRIDLPDVRLCWHPDDGRDFSNALQAEHATIEQCDQTWERIQHAKNRTGVSLKAIFSEIRIGNLQTGCRPGDSGYQAFQVKKDEIDALADQLGLLPSAEMIPLSSFGWSIGLRAKGRLLALVEAGYTPATRKKFQKSGGQRYYMAPDDIEAFHKRFVTLSTLVSQTGDHWSAILARLKASSVRQFSANGEDFGHLYLREEAERAFSRQA